MSNNKDETLKDSLKVEDKLEKSFEEALSHKLTDEDIERARLLIGHDEPLKFRELYSTAHSDALRNWAFGSGDDNPLYTEEDYGLDTRWGGQIGHGTQVGHIKSPMLGDRIPKEIKAQTKGVFRGVHVFVSGGKWEWYRPLRANDRIFCFRGLESIVEKDSSFADRSVIQTDRDVCINQHGEVVGVYRIVQVLTERGKSRKKGKYSEIEPASYTDKDYEKIDAIYGQETVRGANARYFEDVNIGDELQPMAKGPLTVTEIIAFHAGGYGFVPYGLKASRLGFQNRKRIAPFYLKNEQGVWDVAQRLHWDSQWAKAIGNPMSYDYGVMRQAWLYHMVSDWAGDDAFIEKMEDSIRKFNYMGDTQFLTGKVVNKRVEDGRYLVDIEMNMINQRDTETAYGSATVSLPSKETGLSPLPPVPQELQQKATAMFRRHNELAMEKRRGDK
ncbi:MAG: acyl dehydratase [Cellvibrionaceae bacterium]|nr:acyl dehydratase [Cellvibrionaceae bacterium]|tara:strand:- start:65168 stop:66499 length:1332 start_codon:yes stop_codon:yes gene_type:complete